MRSCLRRSPRPLSLPIAVPSASGTFSGANENPPNGSLGTGVGFVYFDDVANTLRVAASFSGLTTVSVAAHIHCCAAPGSNIGVATTTPSFVGFPTGVTSGSFDQTYDMGQSSTWNATFVTANGGTTAAAAAAPKIGLDQGRAYMNIHTLQMPGGEIRANLAPVPEPSTLGLGPLALASLFLIRKRSVRS